MKKFSNYLCTLLITTLAHTPAQAAYLAGKIRIDGSSTVFPITEAVAEEYRKLEPKVKVNIGVSGTGGGFKKFTIGEVDINNASREIKEKEVAQANTNKIEFIKVPVAYDGLTVVINTENDWATELTTQELKLIWDKDSKIKKWSDIRASWPKEEIKLYGPGTDSGTFDYFTDVINGKEGRTRSDYIKSEDDNVLVKGVVGGKYSLGYFGYAYYKENSNVLKSVKINGIAPSEETINNGSYKPLSRPIFIYVNKASIKKPEVKSFINFYLNIAKSIVSDVGYIPLPYEEYQKHLEILKK